MSVPAVLTFLAGLGCLAAGALQIRTSVSAVAELRTRLAAVHRGEGPRVTGSYPSEVQPLVDDLNVLLSERDQRIERAVARAGDLAHGLKTPLAILSRDAGRAASRGDTELAASLTAQVERMRRQIDYHLAHAQAAAAGRAPGVRSQVHPSVLALRRTLERLHADRPLAWETLVDDAAAVRCRREDLEEMLGNLLDNACKWTRSRIRIESAPVDGVLSILVDDDGRGLDPGMVAAVLHRGVRADERTPGSGLGLAIVRDLAELYGGTIALHRSPLGGLRAELRLPDAAAADHASPAHA
jgi:signal transduction histidine kinase